MLSRLAWLALGLACLSSVALADPYSYCVVYASRACFGVAPGDQVVVSAPADFVVYDVTLSSGAQGRIYSGMHANIRGAPFEERAEACIDEDRDCAFLVRTGNQVRGYYTYGGAEVEITFSQIEPQHMGEGKAFLKSFRRCVRGGGGVACTNESVFDVDRDL